MLPSILRTVVPLLVQLVVAQLAKANSDAGPWVELISQAIGAVVAALYYVVVRFLEQHRKGFGWLLGAAKAPTYEATAKVDESSPTGEVAAVDSPVAAEGDPVETVPVPEPVGYPEGEGPQIPQPSVDVGAAEGP